MGQHQTTERRVKLKRKVVRQRGGEWESFDILVPIHLARVIPLDTVFIPELTDEGILYRAVDPNPQEPEPEPESDPLPPWINP